MQNHDDNVYHLELPQHYLRSHALDAPVFSLYGAMPHLIELLYVVPFSLGDFVAPKVFALSVNFWILAGIGAFALPRLGRLGVGVGALLYLSGQNVEWHLGRAYNEPILGFFLLGAALAFLAWWETRREGYLAVVGIACGAACASKYTAWLLSAVILICLFCAIDVWAWRRDGAMPPRPRQGRLRIQGKHNLIIMAGIVVVVLVSGMWRLGPAWVVFDVALPIEDIARDALLVLLTWVSWKTTSAQIRIENAFTWEPMQEVALLFAGIFLTIIPALAILRAGPHGALSGFVALLDGADGLPNDTAYFWLTGALSSLLDNAPTYLVFFNAAGGDAETLMGPLAKTLLAISTAAVFFGAVTYVGNAPNFMVRSICEEHGVRMPSFFGYLVWSGAILLPLFGLVSLVFLRP